MCRRWNSITGVAHRLGDGRGRAAYQRKRSRARAMAQNVIPFGSKKLSPVVPAAGRHLQRSLRRKGLPASGRHYPRAQG
ncbi:hypothetical protein BN1263370218 [Stenotrophomonas maltophilia]|nr:hypothetical protein BN1263370218 [Stenotrophomonas maltophilia]